MEIPKSMNAAILVAQRAPLVVDEVTLPATLEYGQVLVKVHYSGICGSQLGEINGVKGPDRFLPHLLGHEGSGHVVEIGQGVRQVKVGDPVVMHWRKGVGIDAEPPRYTWQGKALNAGFVTTFNEFAVVSENRLTPLPEFFPMDLAPLFGCAVTTGFGVITNNARLKPGESIVVFGAGGVGLNVIQAAAMVAATPIVAVDLFDHRLEMARSMGADHVLNSNECDAEAEIAGIIGPHGADVVVDNTGSTEVISLGYRLTHTRGRMILVGVPPKGESASIYTLPLHFGKVLTGSHGGESSPSEDIPRYIKLFDAGRLRLDTLITDRFTLPEINDALDRLRSGGIAGRCLIEMDKS